MKHVSRIALSEKNKVIFYWRKLHLVGFL